MDVEVRVVHVDVPSERVADERKRRGEVEELEEDLVVGDGAQQVQRPVRSQAARAFLQPVDAVDRTLEPRAERRLHGVGNDDEPSFVEVDGSVTAHARDTFARGQRVRYGTCTISSLMPSGS